MTRKRDHNLEEELSAYLDGELDDARRAEVEAWLAEDASARELLKELRQTVRLVKGLDRKSAPDNMVDDLMARLERQSLLGREEADFLPPSGGRRFGRYLATAAVLLLTASVALVVFQQQEQLPLTTATKEPAAKTRRIADRGSEASADREFGARKTELQAGAKEGSKLIPPVSEYSAGRTSAGEGKAKLESLGYVGRDVQFDKQPAKGGTQVPPPAVQAAPEITHPASPAARPAPMAEAPADRGKAGAVSVRKEVGAVVDRAEPVGAVHDRESSKGEIAVREETPEVAVQGKSLPASTPAVLAESDADQSTDGIVVHEVVPDEVLKVVCADADSQLQNATAAEAYFLANDVEVVGTTPPDEREHMDRHPTSQAREDRSLLENQEPQYLIRASRNQVAGINKLFLNDSKVVNVTIERAAPGQVALVESGPQERNRQVNAPVGQRRFESNATSQQQSLRLSQQTRQQVLIRLQMPRVQGDLRTNMRSGICYDNIVEAEQQASSAPAESARRTGAMRPAELPTQSVPTLNQQITQSPPVTKDRPDDDQVTVLIRLQQVSSAAQPVPATSPIAGPPRP